jgi:NAD(P)-dependent dehydrogenase (short-subunit alcohol dehydrogenase family)
MPNENGSFAEKVAFVTGAANGIGRAAALAFAREGANVVVSDISEQGNQETARMIEELGGRALAVRCDVTRAEDVKAALDEGVEAFGHLDFAFNNAGSEQAMTATADLTQEEWDRIVRVNLRSVFLCMKYEIPLLLKQGGGAIVNTSSGAGVKGIGGSGRILRREIRHRGPHEGGGPRLREVEYPRERRVPGDHRHPDDGSLQRRHPRGAGEGDRAGAGRTDGQARGDRGGRHLALFGRGGLRHRARHGHRRRPDGVANAVVPASFT